MGARVKMLDMDQLPLPNPGDWITITGAADLLGCSRRTVGRMVAGGQLHAYPPRHGLLEQPLLLLWYPEVQEVLAARKRLGRG